jgi:hypothetical protein
VVVTHHLPSQRCVAPQWAGHPLNPFFVCELDALIQERRPAIWIHGHTHDSVDVRVGETRILCNPFGYPRTCGRFVEEARERKPDPRCAIPSRQLGVLFIGLLIRRRARS